MATKEIDVSESLLSILGLRGCNEQLVQAMSTLGLKPDQILRKDAGEYYTLTAENGAFIAAVNYFDTGLQEHAWGLSQVTLLNGQKSGKPCWPRAWFQSMNPQNCSLMEAQKLFGKNCSVMGNQASFEAQLSDGRFLILAIVWDKMARQSHHVLECTVVHMGGFLLLNSQSSG